MQLIQEVTSVLTYSLIEGAILLLQHPLNSYQPFNRFIFIIYPIQTQV